MRLLLVEDETKVASVVARGLRAESFSVDVAHDGDAGWEMAASVDYDLIILDLMLPGMSGTELLRRLRQSKRTAAVLVLTARDATADKVANFEAGADDYLTKPFAFAELVVRVKSLLRRPPVNPTHVLRVADLELDRLTQQVRVAWLNVNTARQVLRTSEELVRNAGEAYELAQARYTAGLSSVVELSQAQLNQVAAQINEANAHYELLQDEASLDYQTGVTH